MIHATSAKYDAPEPNKMNGHHRKEQPVAIQELMATPQWVGYNMPDKVLLNVNSRMPNGRLANAKVNNRKTWATYEQAIAARNAGLCYGVGFVVTEDLNITGIDLDKVIENGETTDVAASYITLFNSFTYGTPSGLGRRIFVHGTIQKSITSEPFIDCVEAYSAGRYFTITEEYLEDLPQTIEHRQRELTNFYSTVVGGRTSKKKKAVREIEKKIDEFKTATEGGRNSLLSALSFRAGKLCTCHGLVESAIKRAILKACDQNGLLLDEPGKTEDTLDRQFYAGSLEAEEDPDGCETAADSDPTQRLYTFEPNDVGNAEAVQSLYGSVIRYCGAFGWIVYTGSHWQIDSGDLVDQKIVHTLRERRTQASKHDKEAVIKCCLLNSGRVNACRERLRSLPGITIHNDDFSRIFDSHQHLLNCASGTVDLRTGKVHDYTPDDYLTYCLHTRIGTKEQAEPYVKLLSDNIAGGDEVVHYFHKALGYSLTGSTKEECLFYLHGPTRGCKGTVTEPVEKLLESLAAARDFNTFTAKREASDQNFDLASLRSSRLVLASESNKYQSLNPGKIKHITGGDSITAAFKGKDTFNFRPQFKVWLLSNHPCNGDASDDALWVRVRIMEFPNSYKEREDTSLKDGLKSASSLEGLLWWAIQGAVLWYQEGLGRPQAIMDATAAHRAECDYVQQWLSECAVVEEGAYSLSKTVVESYTAWSKENSAPALQYRSFNESMEHKGFVKTKKRVGNDPNPLHYYSGIRIIDHVTVTLKR